MATKPVFSMPVVAGVATKVAFDAEMQRCLDDIWNAAVVAHLDTPEAEALAAEVQADANAAEAAAADAAALATPYASVSAVEAATVSPSVNLIRVMAGTTALAFAAMVGGTALSDATGRDFDIADHVAYPEHFKAAGDGVTDDRLVLQEWLDYCVAKGKIGVAFDAKTYLVSNGTISGSPPASLQVDLSGDLELHLGRNTVIKSDASVEGPLIRMRDATGRDRYGVTIRGGVIDNSLGVWVDDAQTNTCLDLIRLRRVSIDGVSFLGGNDIATGTFTSDAGITPTDVRDMTVSGCFFNGVQSGIYATGVGGEDSGGEHIVTGCHFTNCQRAMQTKAEVKRTIFANNNCTDILGYVFTTIEVSGDYPAKQAIVIGNTTVRVGGLAMLRGPGSGSIIADNSCLDFGFEPDGTTQVSTPQAIRLLGISDVTVTGNFIGMDEWTASSNHIGVFLSAFTLTTGVPDAGPRAADRCFVAVNTIQNVYTAIQEGASTPRGVNYYAMNRISGETNRYVALLAGGSTIIDLPDGGFGVGKTATTSVGSVGIGLNADGLLNATRDAGTVAQLNRLTDHGTVLSILQAGVSQGSLQSAATLGLILNGVPRMPSFTVAGLSGLASSWARAVVWCSNGDAGNPCLAVSDGTNWRRIALGATISAT